MSNSIKTLFYEKQDYSNIEFEKCKDGNLTFKNTKNGKGVYIHSKYNPIKEAQTFAEKLEFEKDSIIILFGFGLGHFIREILKKCSNRNIIVVYEPDNVLFSKVVDEGVCSDIFENNKVIVYSDSNVDNFGNFIKTLIKTNMYMRCKFFVTPTYEQLYHNECIKFFEHNKNMMSENIIRRNTIWDKSILWVKNPYENFETTLDSFSSSQMKNLFKGKTAVVVSAGPSLKKNMNMLKEIKGKMPIISVFVAGKVLLENGIIPDFICSIDSKQIGMTEGVYDNIPLIYDSRIPKEFLNTHKGIKIALDSISNTFHINIMKKYNRELFPVYGGGSVACDCLCIAEILGCKNIILIGQDLAYTDNMCHVDGTTHQAKTIDEVNGNKFPIESIDGGTVLTDSIFKYYIDWFQNKAESIKNDINVIDATEGGALIKNTEILTFKKAIEKYNETADVSGILNNFFKGEKNFSKEEKENILADFEKEIQELYNILEIINEEDILFDKYIKLLDDRKNIDPIIKVEEKLDEYDNLISEKCSKIEMILFLADSLIKANSYISGMTGGYNDDPVKDSAIRRKATLKELQTALLSIKELYNQKEEN